MIEGSKRKLILAFDQSGQGSREKWEERITVAANPSENRIAIRPRVQ